MAGQRGPGLLLLLLLSLDVLDLTLETTTMLPTADSTTTATTPPFSSETSTPEVVRDASTVTPRGSSPTASSTATPQARGSTAHSTPESPASTTVKPKLAPTGLELTTGTPTPTLMAVTTNCAAVTTIVTSVGTSTALALSSSGVETSPPPAPNSTLFPSPWVGTTLGTSTRRGPAVTASLDSTSPGPGSASSPTAAAPTAASDEYSATSPDTVTSMEVPESIPASSQPVGTSPGTTILAASEAAAETSALLPTTDSTTTAVVPSSRPATGVSILERSSTSKGNDNTSPPTPLSTTPALTAASAEPLTTPSDTTEDPSTRITLPRSSPTSSQTAGTMARTTPGISTLTLGTTLGTLTEPVTPSAATGMEPSPSTINSTQTTEFTLSNPTDLPTTLPVCPTVTSNTSASRLFLSLRITVPLDLGNTTVQELVLSKLRQDLQTAFPCAGLAVEWRGQRRT